MFFFPAFFRQPVTAYRTPVTVSLTIPFLDDESNSRRGACVAVGRRLGVGVGAEDLVLVALVADGIAAGAVAILAEAFDFELDGGRFGRLIDGKANLSFASYNAIDTFGAAVVVVFGVGEFYFFRSQGKGLALRQYQGISEERGGAIRRGLLVVAAAIGE